MSADRIYGLIRRVLRRTIDTTTPSVQVQIESLADELHNDVECSETYGMTTNPPDDVPEGVGVFLGGESDHGVVVAWFDKVHRPPGLLKGEVVFYSAFGQRIKFDNLGQVVITSSSGSKTEMLASGDIVHTPSSQKMIVVGDLEVTKNIHAAEGITAVLGISSQGAIHSDADVTAGAISLLGHHHGNVINGGNVTDPPS